MKHVFYRLRARQSGAAIMSENVRLCLGCAHCVRRFRTSQVTQWCVRYHVPAAMRCVDYRKKRTAIQTALDYLRDSKVK